MRNPCNLFYLTRIERKKKVHFSIPSTATAAMHINTYGQCISLITTLGILKLYEKNNKAMILLNVHPG